MSIEHEISTFIDDLIQESQITDSKIIDSARLEIAANLQEFVILKLSEKLSSEDRTELFDLIETFPKTFEPNTYLQSKLVDYEDRVRLLLAEFKKIYLQK